MERRPRGEKKDLARLLLVAALIALFLLSVRGIFRALPGREGENTPGMTAAGETYPAATPVTTLTPGTLSPAPAWTVVFPSPGSTPLPSYTPTTEVPPQALGWLAFVSSQGRYPVLYAIHASGSGLVALSEAMGFIGGPAWAPNGTRLVFWAIQDVNAESGEADLYTVNADGSGFTNLTQSPSTEMSPDWAPDGEQIVFVATRTGKEELFVIHADGTGLRQLTDDPETFARDPRWSADGEQIAFTCTSGLESFICLIKPDGSGLTRLTPGISPRWSPMAKHMAFIGPGSSGSSDLYIINDDGSGLRNLTGSPANESSFEWSPDGEWLAFESSRGNGTNLYTLCAACGAGAQPGRVSGDPALSCTGPVWSPDSRELACLMDGTLYRVYADGTGLTRLTEGVLPGSYAWGAVP